MADDTTLKIPTKVVDSDWKDDIDYEPFEEEKTYISPNEIDPKTIARIKKSPIKLTIKNMVNWEELTKKITV